MNELRPCKDLLNNSFSGYKLSLSPLSHYSLVLNKCVDVVEPTDDQYSFLHQREFTLHNHLHSDTWNPNNVYFIDKLKTVNQVIINSTTGRLESLKNVLLISDEFKRQGGEFNFSLCFPSEEYVLIGDGSTSVYIASAVNRHLAESWKVVHVEKVFEESHPFHLIDSRCSQDGLLLDFLLLHVELKDSGDFEADKKENKNTSKYETVLEWITFKKVENSWKLENKSKLHGKGSLDYAAIEVGCEAVYIASANKFKSPHSAPESPQQENGSDLFDYEWEQGFEEIRLTFDGVETKEGVSITWEDQTISVKHSDALLLKGDMFQPVDTQLTSWTCDNSKLEVVIHKRDSGRMWQRLTKKESSDAEKVFVGKEKINQELAQQISRQLQHHTSEKLEESSGVINDWQMEDCDAFEEDFKTLYRYKKAGGEPTHKVVIGGAQWLLTVRTGGGEVPAPCIRSDVDGCVWMVRSPSDGVKWKIDHVATFFAFGYVLASKVNRKFTLAPPDLSYVSVIDDTGHVIIYRKGVALNTELRNRKSGALVSSIATQNMVNLQTKGNILGAVANNHYLFVLTSDSIHVVHII